MDKNFFIESVSKINQTFEDEFKAEFNSPEYIWEEFLELNIYGILDFIHEGYSPLMGEWHRKNDDKIVNNSQLLIDYADRNKK